MDAYITSQILYEFFSVITNSRRVENPLTKDEAIEICEDLLICPQIKVIDPHSSTTFLIFDLIRKYNITGAQIFDCIIAATAKEHNINRIYTQNINDFAHFDFLEVVNPLL